MAGRDLQIAEAEPGIKYGLVGCQAHGDGNWPKIEVVVGEGESHY